MPSPQLITTWCVSSVLGSVQEPSRVKTCDSFRFVVDGVSTKFDGGTLLTVIAVVGAGAGSVRWDGRDDAGHPLPMGTYFVRLEARGVTRVRKIIVVE